MTTHVVTIVRPARLPQSASRLPVLIAACIGCFLCILDATVMNIALPVIQTGLGTNLGAVQWALNAYIILFAALTIPMSSLAGRLGTHRFFLAGLLIFLLGSLFSGLAPNLPFLIGSRMVQSLGAAVIFPLSMIIGISTTTVAERTKVIAALGMAQGLAAAVGPSVGGIITQFLGWRWIFFINLPLILVAVLLCVGSRGFLRADQQPSSEQVERTERTEQTEQSGQFEQSEQAGSVTQAGKIDLPGSLLSMVSLFALTLALVQGRSWGWGSLPVLGLFALALLAGGGLLWQEKRTSSPMIPLQLFRSRQFNGAVLAIIFSNLFLSAVTVVLPNYLTKIEGQSELQAALLLTPVYVMVFIFSPIAALLVGRLGARLTVLLGFLSMGTAYVLFSTIDLTAVPALTVACLLLGFGYGIIAGPIVVLAAADFTGAMLNASQSVAGVLRQVGIVLAVALFITGLYTNLGAAKTESVSYAQGVVAGLGLPAAQAQDMMSQIKRQIDSERASAAGSRNHVSAAERAGLVEQAYQTALAATARQSGVPVASLPRASLAQVKTAASRAVDAKIAVVNAKVNGAIGRISRHAKSQFSDAFIQLYRVSIPLVFLAAASAWLFAPRRAAKS